MLVETTIEPGTKLTDDQALELAIRCARNGVRSANPLVGAVIVDAAGRLLHTGWHRGAGTRHAEADAIFQAEQAGTDLSGATMYVSLEPCNHTGHTGPCSHAVLDAGISRLVYAHRDDTDKAAGGAEFLAQHGVTVEYVPRQEAADLNARWFEAQAQKRPFITGKIASTMDGFISAADSTSQWITGAESRLDGHKLRERVDAILVGTQTAITDDPQLTARTSAGERTSHQPLRVVMGERKLPGYLLISQAIERGDNAIQLKTLDSLHAAQELYRRGVRHLMIEGGPTVLSGFLQAGLVDELYWYQAPMMLGAGRRAVGELGIETLTQAQHWQLDDLGAEPAVLRLGNDVRFRYIPATKTHEPH